MKKTIYFWAKTTSDGRPGLSVYDHMVNVGCVAREIAKFYPILLQKYNLDPDTIGFLAALHDIGKISPGFQRKCQEWIEENGLVDLDKRYQWHATTESDHGKVSHKAIQDILNDKDENEEVTAKLAAVLGAHHGKLKFLPDERGIRLVGINENHSGVNWDSERKKVIDKIYNYFTPKKLCLDENGEIPYLWWLAGLTSVSDWIGSDENHFSNEQINDRTVSQAKIALKTIGIENLEINSQLTFNVLFGNKFDPNNMQAKAIDTITGPGVYIIEAPMGMGKTEAALAAAYQIIAQNKANGIYFALPTQATSNRIHLRIDEFLKVVEPSQRSRLIHGNSWLIESTNNNIRFMKSDEASKEDEKTTHDWFSSPKRALLAPFGVGTIDQALLGVVATKHFFVRRFALAGKVVIIDEVHSYDLYTGTLIDKLINVLEGLGCTVIILSATLTEKRREQILGIQSTDKDDHEKAYPLITGRKGGKLIKPVAATPPLSKNIQVEFKAWEGASIEAIEIAGKGGAVLWICNTIDSAQKQYEYFHKNVNEAFKIGLLHSRYPFWRRDELEREWMGRFGKDGKGRCGSILVSTQIVEQSVDLDADMMISELAPTDMLLQRLGRLWRHKRKDRPVKNGKLIILSEEKEIMPETPVKEIKEILGNKAYVYAPYVLLRTLEVWKGLKVINIPGQIRELLERTYSEQDNESEILNKLYEDWFGTDSAKKMKAQMAANEFVIALKDVEGLQTRLNEIPTASLILCEEIIGNQISFIDGSTFKIKKDNYDLDIARTVHKNLVKIPRHHFEEFKKDAVLDEYIYEDYKLALVNKNGDIDVAGLKKSVKLYYSSEKGLEIIK